MASARSGASAGGGSASVAAVPPVSGAPAAAPQASSPPRGDDRLAKYLMELWGKCRQSEDATVCRAELERTLFEVVGIEGQAQVLTQLCMGKTDREEGPSSFDFLSYWQGMDRFFATKQQRWPHEGDRSVSADTVRGLQRFRDSLLSHWRNQGAFGLGDSISPAQVLAMLEDIKAGAQDQQYWQVNMDAIADLDGDAEGVQPCDLADAIHCWLNEIVEGSPGGQEAARAVEEHGDPSGRGQLDTPAPTTPSQTVPPTTPQRDRARRTKTMPAPMAEADSRSQSPPSRPRSQSPLGRYSSFGGRRPSHTTWPVHGKQRASTVQGLRQSRASMSRQRLSTSSDCAEGAISKELHRAYEVIENLRNLTDTRNHKAHSALEDLLKLQSSLGQQLHAQDSEISRLRESGEVLRRRRQDLEAELLRHVEVAEGHSDAAMEADVQRRRADALEREVLDLREHYAESCKEVQELQAQVAEAERQQGDIKQLESVWGHRCEQLEQETDRTDGQRQWMQAELSRQGTQLSSTEELVRQLRGESAKLRASLGVARRAARSASAYADEEGESAAELRRLLGAAASAQPAAAVAALAAQAPLGPGPADAAAASAAAGLADVGAGDRTQRKAIPEQAKLLHKLIEELSSLREERNRLLEREPPAAKILPTFFGDEQRLEEEEVTPRRRQAERRCDFLTSQVQALLRHTQQVEQLLDNLRDDSPGRSLAPETRRRLSVVDMHKQATMEFNELDTSLHTIEVQKADLDREVERLLRRNAEQAEQLAATQQHRDELLQELATLHQAQAPASTNASMAHCEGSTAWTQGCATTSTWSDEVGLQGRASVGTLGTVRTAAQSAAHSAADDGGFVFGLDTRSTTVITRESLEKQKRREAREKEKTRARLQEFLHDDGAAAAPKARDHDRHKRDKKPPREDEADAPKTRDHDHRHRRDKADRPPHHEAHKSQKPRDEDSSHWQRERHRSDLRVANGLGLAHGLRPLGLRSSEDPVPSHPEEPKREKRHRG